MGFLYLVRLISKINDDCIYKFGITNDCESRFKQYRKTEKIEKKLLICELQNEKDVEAYLINKSRINSNITNDISPSGEYLTTKYNEDKIIQYFKHHISLTQPGVFYKLDNNTSGCVAIDFIADDIVDEIIHNVVDNLSYIEKTKSKTRCDVCNVTIGLKDIARHRKTQKHAKNVRKMNQRVQQTTMNQLQQKDKIINALLKQIEQKDKIINKLLNINNI